MLLAAYNTQQKLGVIIAAVLIVGWVAYIVTHLMKAGPPAGSEIELAPNRKPYFDDDKLETKKLDGALFTALILLAVIAVGLPAYWVREANRQVDANRGFAARSVHRGMGLFQPTDSPLKGAHFGCATCHGADGGGGVAKYSITDTLGRTRQVTWKAPAINTVAYRYSHTTDPNSSAYATNALRQVLVYGRAGSPMPAWGTKGGGPMNDQQIDDLVNYLTTPKSKGGLMLSADEAKAATAAAATAEAKAEGKVDAEGNPIIDGQVLFNANCARCHTRGWSYGEPEVSGGGRYGPSLRGGSTVRQFPDEADMIKFITVGVEYGQPYGVGGIGQNAGGGMPHFGEVLSDSDIQKIVEYERSL